jgi:hypothetical protein
MTTPTTLDTKLEKRFGTYGKRSDWYYSVNANPP